MTEPSPTPRTRPYPVSPPARTDGRRPVRPVDLTMTVLGLVALAVGALVVTLLALAIGAFVESADPDSNTSGGLAIVLVPTWVLLGFALTASVALLKRRVLAFWVPLAAGALWCGVVYVAFSS